MVIHFEYWKGRVTSPLSPSPSPRAELTAFSHRVLSSIIPDLIFDAPSRSVLLDACVVREAHMKLVPSSTAIESGWRIWIDAAFTLKGTSLHRVRSRSSLASAMWGWPSKNLLLVNLVLIGGRVEKNGQLSLNLVRLSTLPIQLWKFSFDWKTRVWEDD